MKNLSLIGSGLMAEEYVKVLICLGIDFNVVSTNSERIEYFKHTYNIDAHCADVRVFNSLSSEFVINCVDIPSLFDINLFLLNKKIKNILSEKPVAFDLTQLQALSSFKKSNFVLALNRRFYNSTIEVQKILKQDGGPRTCSFQFNERTIDWYHPYSTPGRIENIKPLHSQSVHLIDLVFYLIGHPVELSTFKNGSHFRDYYFSGSGVTESGCLFSYSSDWSAPGSWTIDVTSKNYRIKLEPIESIKVYTYSTADRANSTNGMTDHIISVNEPSIYDEISKKNKLKHGLLLQTEMFLNQVFTKHGSLSDYVKTLRFMNSI
jgi:predicted dehydrogenase